MHAKKDCNLAKHPLIDVPNLQDNKLMHSFKSAKPLGRPFGSSPPVACPRGARFEGDRPRLGEREGYRGALRAGPGDIGGNKVGAPSEYLPVFRGAGGRSGFGPGGGGGFGVAPAQE